MEWRRINLVLFLTCTTLQYCKSSSNNDHHREFLFNNIPDHILSSPLNATVQKNTKVVDKKDCVFACMRSRPWCGSVNFKIKPENDSLHICLLLSTDIYSRPSYLKPAKGFTHLSIENKCMDQTLCKNNGSCYPDYDNDDYHCVCKGSKGKNCQIFYRNCFELLSAGHTADGVYQIDPDGQGSFPVYCDMTTDSGGWTVFQRRDNHLESFDRGWQEYKTGFGNLKGEFWLGLEKIRRLINRPATVLRVDLEESNGIKKHAVYSSFSIADESDFYRLSVSGYSGTAGNALADGNVNYRGHDKRFSTPDKDNDVRDNGSCAQVRKAGWWYGHCTLSDLNSVNTFWTSRINFMNTEMKLK